MSIPADLNDLMWQIAEKQDANAARDFSQKFPAMANDMQERMRMVSGMKEMRSAIAPGFVPAFKPKYMPTRTWKWKRYAPLALGISALAAASYYVTQNVLTPLPDLSSRFPKAEVAKPQATPPPFINLPSQTPKDDPDSDTPRPFIHGDGGSNSTDVANQNWKEFFGDNMPLQTAMRTVAKRWSLTLEIPPNTPNPMLKHVEMFGHSGMDFLNQLADQGGVTVFDEGNGHVLVIPARDATAPPN